MMLIENEYEIGDIVYLKTEREQTPRIIIAIYVYKNGELLYKTASGVQTSEHYSFELSKEKDLINI